MMTVQIDDALERLNAGGARDLVTAINDDPLTWVVKLCELAPGVTGRVLRETMIALNTGVLFSAVRHPGKLPVGELVVAYRAGLEDAESAVTALYGLRRCPDVAAELRAETLESIASQDRQVRRSAAVTAATVFGAGVASEVLPVLLDALDGYLERPKRSCDEQIAEISIAVSALGKAGGDAGPRLQRALGHVGEEGHAIVAAAVAKVGV